MYNNGSRRNDYDELVRRSTRGTVSKSPARRSSVSRDRYERLKEQYNRKLKRSIITGVVLGAIAVSGLGYVTTEAIPNMVNKIAFFIDIYFSSWDLSILFLAIFIK